MPIIDPTTGQPIGGGPSNQQPTPNVDLSGAIDALNTAASNQEKLAQSLGDALKTLPKVAQETTKSFQGMALELETNLEYITNIEEALKTISATSRSMRQGVFNTKNIKQAAATVNEILKAQDRVKELAGATSKEYAQAVRIQERLKVWLQQNKNLIDAQAEGVEMTKEQMMEFASVLQETVGDSEKLVRNFRALSVNHVTRQIHGMAKALAQIGIGKGFAAKMDKYVAGADIKAKTAEYSKARKEGNVAAAQAKRDAAINLIKANPDAFGVQLDRNGNLDMSKAANRIAVAKKMGLGKKAAGLFVKGEEGAAFEGGVGLFARGASKLAGGVEGAVGGIGGAMASAAPYLAVAEMIKEAYDKTVEQNKTMESSLGKAGLFNQGGTGFMNVRRNLTPHTLFSPLGISYERNLKLAQALQEGGRGVREAVTGEGLGAGSQFGPGGFGRFQKVAFGTARLAGFTDSEGIQQTLKLMDQYRETFQSSEDFFVKVRKSADAAGLSTTKYIQIIDDVNSHFDRMNKQFGKTLNMLTELSRTGRVGAEDLKEFLDFLTKGSPKGTSDVAMNAFVMSNMSPQQKQGLVKGAESALETALKNAADEHIGGLPTVDQLKGKDAADLLAKLDTELANNTALSPSEKANRENAIKNLRIASMQYGAVAGGGGNIGAALAQLYAQTPEGQAAMNQTKLAFSVRGAGGNMDEFMKSGPGRFAADHPIFSFLNEMQGFSADDMNHAWMGRSQAASTMLSNIQGLNGINEQTDGDRKRLTRDTAKEFLREMNRKGVKVLDKDGNSVADNIDAMSDKDLEDVFKNNNFSGSALGSDTLADYIQRTYNMGMDVTGQRGENQRLANKVGIQTQTTGEMIANAFATWFNKIIGFLGTITDHITGTTEKDKKEAQDYYNTEGAQARKNTAESVLAKKLDDAENAMENAKDDKAAYAKAKAEYEKLRDLQRKIEDQDLSKGGKSRWDSAISEVIGGTVGKTAKGAAVRIDVDTNKIAGWKYDLDNKPRPTGFSDAMATTGSFVGALLGHGAPVRYGKMHTPVDEQYANLAGMTYGALTTLGVNMNEKTGQGTVTKDKYNDLLQKGLQPLINQRLVEATQDDKGNYNITVINYGVDANVVAPTTQSPVNQAPEKAKNINKPNGVRMGTVDLHMGNK